MAFPDQTYTDNESAAAALSNKASAAGLDLTGLNPIAQLQSAVANLLVSDPSTVTIPAGDVLSGTFGANKSGGADTGTYVFPSQVGFGTKVISTTALATPSALVATTGMLFASTVSGSSVMGFGTTNDVTLMNRAGTPVLGITANTSDTTLAGALQIGTTLSILGATVNLSTAGAALAFTGTTVAAVADTASGAITFNANIGRGTGAVGGFVFAVPVTTTSGTTAQSLTNGLTVGATTTAVTVYAAGADAAAGTALTGNQGFYSVFQASAIRVGGVPSIQMTRGNGTLAVPTIVANADQLGSLRFQGAVSATAKKVAAEIRATATETWVNATSAGTKLELYVTPNTTSTVAVALTLDQDKSATFAANVNTATYFGSTTALATPSALAATALNAFASTVSGATLMGFGTTNDVSLMNRAGTVVLGVGPNTTAVTMAGGVRMGSAGGNNTLYIGASAPAADNSSSIVFQSSNAATNWQIDSNATTGSVLSLTPSTAAGGSTFTTAVLQVLVTPAVKLLGASTLGRAASADVTTIDGTAYGAGVASLRFNGLSTAAVNNQVGTLTNAPVAGNATFWMPISHAGTIRYIPCW